MHHAKVFLIALFFVCLPVARLNADPAAAGQFSVRAGDQTKSFNVEQLGRDFASSIKLIDFTLKGEKHSAHVVPLLDVLVSAGVNATLKMDPKADPKTKNFPLRETVIITGKDGYASAIALAELLPDIGNHDAYLAIDRDGAPLTDRSAPVELIVPGDVKPGRWVRGVASIVVQAPAVATTQP